MYTTRRILCAVYVVAPPVWSRLNNSDAPFKAPGNKIVWKNYMQILTVGVKSNKFERKFSRIVFELKPEGS